MLFKLAFFEGGHRSTGSAGTGRTGLDLLCPLGQPICEMRELSARSRRAAMSAIAPCAMKGHCSGGRPLSIGARLRCDARAETFNAQPAFAWHARIPHCAGYLSRGSDTRELAARARRAALSAIGPCAIKGHCMRALRPRRVVERASQAAHRARTLVCSYLFAFSGQRRLESRRLIQTRSDGTSGEVAALTMCADFLHLTEPLNETGPAAWW